LRNPINKKVRQELFKEFELNKNEYLIQDEERITSCNKLWPGNRSFITTPVPIKPVRYMQADDLKVKLSSGNK